MTRPHAIKATTARPTQAAPSLDVVTSLNHKKLFAPWFPGPTWDNWKTVLRAAFALPMSNDQTAFFQSIAGGRNPPKRRVRELYAVVGRRGGKDSVASGVAAHAAAMFDQQERLRPGERGTAMCLAVDRDQSKIILNYIRSYFTDIPMLKSMVGRETAFGFELKNGIDIAVATNNYRSVRGRPVLLAVLDECAFFRDENSTTPDVETYNALRPALASLPGSMIIGISSPYKKSGLLWQKFKRHFGQDDDDVLVIQAPTRVLNPTIDQTIIDAAIAEDPASASAEWLAQFRNDIGGWADLALIEQAVDRGVTVRPPLSSRRYLSFCDPSGGARDSFTCAIAHDEGGIAILDNVLEIRAPFNPTSATEQITNLLKSYGLRSTKGDKYGAAWVTDAFATFGIKYEHSERDRSSIYLDCLPLFTSGRARLLDVKRMVQQFASLERRTSSIGKDRVDHGPGGSDDLCNAAAGALVRTTDKVQSARRVQINFMGR